MTSPDNDRAWVEPESVVAGTVADARNANSGNVQSDGTTSYTSAP